jgi:hypothetical protein
MIYSAITDLVQYGAWHRLWVKARVDLKRQVVSRKDGACLCAGALLIHLCKFFPRFSWQSSGELVEGGPSVT